jgi:tape measure domain-containing protein
MAFAYAGVKVDLDDASFNRSVNSMTGLWKSAMDSMANEARAFDTRWQDATAGIKDTKRIVSGILVSQAFYTLSNVMIDASGAALQFSKDMQTAAISMEYFVKGADKAQKAAAYLREINVFAARTPFSTQEALSLSKYMQAMGVGMEQTKSFLGVITDTAAATGATEQNLQRITFGLGQMLTKGRLANEEIRQLANANIPIYDILQVQLGLTGEQISKIGNYWYLQIKRLLQY